MNEIIIAGEVIEIAEHYDLETIRDDLSAALEVVEEELAWRESRIEANRE